MVEYFLFFSPLLNFFVVFFLVFFFFFGGHSLVCYSYLAFASSVIHYFCFAGHTVWELPCCRLMIDNVAIFVVGNGITNL
jgi:hypothetical protein